MGDFNVDMFINHIYLELSKPGRQTLTFCVTFHIFPYLKLACLLCCSQLMSVVLRFFALLSG